MPSNKKMKMKIWIFKNKSKEKKVLQKCLFNIWVPMKGDKIFAQSWSNVWLTTMHAFDGMGI
jgi:hypothetical protein